MFLGCFAALHTLLVALNHPTMLVLAFDMPGCVIMPRSVRTGTEFPRASFSVDLRRLDGCYGLYRPDQLLGAVVMPSAARLDQLQFPDQGNNVPCPDPPLHCSLRVFGEDLATRLPLFFQLPITKKKSLNAKSKIAMLINGYANKWAGK
jgi:hypothetical protein